MNDCRLFVFVFLSFCIVDLSLFYSIGSVAEWGKDRPVLLIGESYFEYENERTTVYDNEMLIWPNIGLFRFQVLNIPDGDDNQGTNYEFGWNTSVIIDAEYLLDVTSADARSGSHVTVFINSPGGDNEGSFGTFTIESEEETLDGTTPPSPKIERIPSNTAFT